MDSVAKWTSLWIVCRIASAINTRSAITSRLPLLPPEHFSSVWIIIFEATIRWRLPANLVLPPQLRRSLKPYLALPLSLSYDPAEPRCLRQRLHAWLVEPRSNGRTLMVAITAASLGITPRIAPSRRLRRSVLMLLTKATRTSRIRPLSCLPPMSPRTKSSIRKTPRPSKIRCLGPLWAVVY